jgi:membrane fusion protein (multidrug efflux system)
MEKKKVIIPVAIIVVAAVTMVFLSGFRKEAEVKKPVVRSKVVNARLVQLAETPAKITAYGRLRSAEPVQLYSEVAGVLRAGDVPFKPSQAFKKGDLLVKVDDRQIRLDINSAKSDLLNALATVLPEIKVDFPQEFNKWQDYFNSCGFDHKLSPLPEIGDPKIKLYLSRFNVFKLYFAVQNLEIRLEKHYFYAPFNGTIIATDIQAGSTARAGSRIGEIISLDQMEVEVPVPTGDIRWIDRGKPVEFTSNELPGKWKGQIKRIGQNIDERTQSVAVFISLVANGSGPLPNGVFLTAHIPGQMIPNSYTIPRRALYNEHFAYFVNGGKLEYREVQIARRETDSVIADGGLADNDTLVVDVLQGVAEGMPARAQLGGR